METRLFPAAVAPLTGGEVPVVKETKPVYAE